MTTKLAWKNIWRNKTRSFVFIGSAVLGFAMALFTLNTMKAISEQRLSDAINIETSYIQIHRAGFIQNKGINDSIPQEEEIISLLQSIPEIENYSQRIVSEAVMASPENNIGIELLGVKAGQEKAISALDDFLVQGEWLNEEVSNPILISKKNADKLHLELGSKVIITLQASDGQIIGGAFRVAGIFVTPSTLFDEGKAVVNYADLKNLVNISASHELAIKVSEPAEVTSVMEKMEAQLNDTYQVNDWKYLLPELFAFDSFINMVGVLFTIIIIVGLGFSLMNTMNMIVQERSKELGMLRAIGQGKWSVFRMLLQEAAYMMVMGAIGGLSLGIVFVLVASRHGIRISQGLDFLGIRPVIYPQLNPALLIMILIMTIVLTVIISLFPSSKAFRIKPQEALREI